MRFPSVVLVSAAVLATAAACGSTTPPALRPAPSPPASIAAVPPPISPGLSATDIDARLADAWTKASVTAAAATDDATFERRAYIDLVGTIPTSEDVTAFLSDNAPDKRDQLVDRLVADPRFADNLAAYWDHILMDSVMKDRLVDRGAFQAFLRDRLGKNAGWDAIVRDIVAATGISGGESDGEHPVNGAVNFVAKYQGSIADLTGEVSKTFLGVQIQCAQCHDHKTEKWKMTDFSSFAACFATAKIKPIDPPMVKGPRHVLVSDAAKPVNVKRDPMRKEIGKSQPVTLDGTDLEGSDAPRQALAQWLTADKNPWFSRAIVNRMWAHYLGRGFVNPVDDFRDSNPPELPELLDAIADDFRAHGYDLKRLAATITKTRAYRESAFPAQGKNELWSRFRTAPLGPDELVDALVTAEGIGPDLAASPEKAQAFKDALRKQVTFLFDTDEEDDAPDFEGTITQALFLLNGRAVSVGLNAGPTSTLGKAMALPDGKPRVEALYLAALSRPPTDAEVDRALRYVESATAAPDVAAPAANASADLRAATKEANQAGKKSKKVAPPPVAGPPPAAPKPLGPQQRKRRAYEDLFFSLLNSSEFAFNH